MILFNLVVFALSALFLFRTAIVLKLALPGIAPFVLLSSMVYFKMVNAGMTEILMAGIGIASVYLVTINRYTLAAIVASFSIVARPESVILIPLMALLLAWERKWRVIPWLALGFSLYTFIGFFFGDKSILWVLSEDPYPAMSPYGSGSFTRFLENSDLIFGYFIIPTFLLCLVFLMLRSGKLGQSKIIRLGWFSVSMVLLVLFLHSYLWWQGLKGSLGLIRVMATVIPMAALASMIGLNFFLQHMRYRKLITVLAVITLLLADVYAYRESELPRVVSPRERVLQKASDWYMDYGENRRVSYLDPYIAFLIGLDPLDETKVWSLLAVDKSDPSISLEPGDIIIWDSLFGPREAGIAEEAITENPRIKVRETYISNWDKTYRVHIAEVLEDDE